MIISTVETGHIMVNVTVALDTCLFPAGNLVASVSCRPSENKIVSINAFDMSLSVIFYPHDDIQVLRIFRFCRVKLILNKS